jgi:hypothetical protein
MELASNEKARRQSSARQPAVYPQTAAPSTPRDDILKLFQ